MAVKVEPEQVGLPGLDSIGGGDDGQPGAQVWAQFAASLSGIQAELAAQRDHRERVQRALQPIKVTLPAITTPAGAINLPDICGPRDGYVWDLHIVTLNSAMTGGTVAMFSGGGGVQEFVFSQAGLLEYGKGHLILKAKDWLTFQAAGLVGSAQFCLRATQIEAALLPDYLN